MPRGKKIPQPEPKSKKAPVQKTLPPEVPDHKLKRLAEMRAERLASTSSPTSALGAQIAREFRSPEDLAAFCLDLRELAEKTRTSGHPQSADALVSLVFGAERLAYEYWGKEGLAVVMMGYAPQEAEEPASEETGSDDEGELDLTLTGAGDLRAALSS